MDISTKLEMMMTIKPPQQPSGVSTSTDSDGVSFNTTTTTATTSKTEMRESPLPLANGHSSNFSNIYTATSSVAGDNQCALRYYYCDVVGTMCAALQHCIRAAFNKMAASTTKVNDNSGKSREIDDVFQASVLVFPHMRFLHYATSGGFVEPHIDLSRTTQRRLLLQDSATPLSSSVIGSTVTSTHTFILYLNETSIEAEGGMQSSGGETVLLDSVHVPVFHRKIKEYESFMLREVSHCKTAEAAKMPLLERVDSISNDDDQDSLQSPSGTETLSPATAAAAAVVNATPPLQSAGGVIATIAPKKGRLLLFPHSCPHAGLPSYFGDNTATACCNSTGTSVVNKMDKSDAFIADCSHLPCGKVILRGEVFIDDDCFL
jgi:hypothetical protein